MRQVSKWLSPLPTHAHTINISFLPISFTWTLPQLWEVSLPGIVILPLCRWKTKTREIDPDFPKAIELPSSRGRIPTQAFHPHVVSLPMLLPLFLSGHAVSMVFPGGNGVCYVVPTAGQEEVAPCAFVIRDVWKHTEAEFWKLNNGLTGYRRYSDQII